MNHANYQRALKYGKSLPERERIAGAFKVYGSNGPVGTHNAPLTKKETIIVGRKGSIGEVHLSTNGCWPIDTTYYIDEFYGQPAKFWFYRLKELNLGSYNRATAIPGLTREDAYQINIAVPPLAEQQRIVAKIDSLFARTRKAREELARIPILIEHYKQVVLAVAFRGDLTADWREENPDLDSADSSLRLVRKLRQEDRRLARRCMVETVPRMQLPRTWAWISPDEIADDSDYSIGIGPFGSNLLRSDYKKKGVRLIFVRDIRRECFEDNEANYVTQDKAEELYQHHVRGGDVLITKMGDPPGDTTMYPEDAASAVITADCIKLRPHRSLALSQYLVYCIRSNIVRSQVLEITKGVAQQKVSLKRFRRIALPIPPLAEQREIVRRIEAAMDWLNVVAAEQGKAAQLLDHLDHSLLAKAFRGELVAQDPDDEPAEKLLERIRAEQANQTSLSRRSRGRNPSLSRS